VTDEIALNPAHFATRPPAEVLATLAHEMVHLWQHHFGTPGRGAYHNEEWAAKMRAVGLVPRSIDRPGKETGQKVTHDILPGGPFDRTCGDYLETHDAILYQDRATDEAAKVRKKKAASKTRYTCPACDLNAWAKPGAHLVCGECEEVMAAEEAGEPEGEDSP
jgi:hypothetical protein